LANIQFVLLPLVAWAVLAERPSRRVLAALPVALVGVVLISGALEHGAYGQDPGRGTVFGLASGVAYVGYILLLRRGGADLRRVAGPLFDATATATVVAIVAGVIVGNANFTPAWPGVGWLVVLALSSQVIGWLLIGSSLPRLPAAMTSVILLVQPVGAVGLGALILGESPSALQLVGVAVLLCAMVVATRPPAAARLSEQVLRFRAYQRRGPRAVARADVPAGAADQD
jgi:drug/metabolite transporter (DMT)-like permease